MQADTKWQARKDAFDGLVKLTEPPKLVPGDMGDLVRAMKKVCGEGPRYMRNFCVLRLSTSIIGIYMSRMLCACVGW